MKCVHACMRACVRVREWEVHPKNIGGRWEVGLINRCEVGRWPKQ